MFSNIFADEPHDHAADTSAGFLYPRKEASNEALARLLQEQGLSNKEKKLDADKLATHVAVKEYRAMQALAQLFVVRCVGFFLFSVALFNVLAFFEAKTTEERYPCALSVIVNLVAAMHYRTIAWIKMDRSLTRTLAAYAIDAARYGEWLVTLVFLVRKIYFYINHDPFDAHRHFFFSVEAAVGTAVAMVLLGALARLGTDEMWDWQSGGGADKNAGVDSRAMRCFFFGGIPFAGSLACLVFLLVDMTNASFHMEDAFLFRSFFLVWIVYPVIALASILLRQKWCSRDGSPYAGTNMLKDLSYGLADVWSKGVFGLWTGFTVFNVALFGAPAAAPYAWASPPPAAP